MKKLQEFFKEFSERSMDTDKMLAFLNKREVHGGQSFVGPKQMVEVFANASPGLKDLFSECVAELVEEDPEWEWSDINFFSLMSDFGQYLAKQAEAGHLQDFPAVWEACKLCTEHGDNEVKQYVLDDLASSISLKTIETCAQMHQALDH